MKSRLLSGAAGVAVLVFAAISPQVLLTSEISMIGGLAGYLMFVGMMLGVYLLFYCMAGEWLHKFKKRKTLTQDRIVAETSRPSGKVLSDSY